MARFCSWCAIFALLLAGCGRSPDTADTSATDAAASNTTGQTGTNGPPARSPKPAARAGDEAPPVPADTTRRSLAGRWAVVLYVPSREQPYPAPGPLGLLDVKRDGDEYQARLLPGGAAGPPTTLKSSELDDTTAHLVLELQGNELDFRGTLDEGTVRGTLAFPSGQVVPARLVATSAATLPEVRIDNNQERAAISEAERSDDPVASLRAFAEKHRDSVLALNAYETILGLAKPEGLDQAAVEEITAEYFEVAKRWGPRQETNARLNAGLVLTMSRHLPELALEYLDEAEAALPENAEQLKSVITTVRGQAETAIVLRQLTDGTEEEQQQALQTLNARREAEPFNPHIQHALAEHAERQDRTDEAIELYTQLAVQPMADRILMQEWAQAGLDKPAPSKALATLWENKHGDTKELEAHLDKVYRRMVHTLAGEKVTAPDDGNRTVLVELFTGASCPPCVAADLATGAIELTYSGQDVIVLRYHQHVPAPDQFANPDAVRRFAEYYEGRGTPMILVNGRDVGSVGGILEHVPPIYERLREEIEPHLAEQTELDIRLSAEAEEGVIALSAEVAGLESPDGPLRLRLVLAEQEIAFVAPNGIRLHEMLVRNMPGGPKGIAPQEGRLAYSDSVKVARLREQLSDYLAAFEETEGIDFAVKPLALDKLHLIAFVQNDETKEVLQAARIPVSGLLEAAPADDPPPAEAETPAKADESSAEEPKPEVPETVE